MTSRGFAVAATVLLLAACGPAGEAAQTTTTSSATSSATPSLGAAAQTCQDEADVAENPQDSILTSQLEDRATSITLQTNLSGNASPEAVWCVLRETKAPEFVVEHIKSTRALDGAQTDEWSGFRARWTYHPDDGLNISIIQSG